jgi:hypothetical protein
MSLYRRRDDAGSLTTIRAGARPRRTSRVTAPRYAAKEFRARTAGNRATSSALVSTAIIAGRP